MDSSSAAGDETQVNDASGDAPSLLTAGFVLAWCANFLHSMALHSYVHLAGFLEGLHMTEIWIGVVIGTMSLVAIAARPGIGWTMDRQGRRNVILVGGILNVISALCYLWVDAFGPWLFLVRVIHGVAQAAVFSGMFTYAADVVPAARRAQGIALFGISGMLPLSLAGLIGDWVLVDGDYTFFFELTAAYAFGALLLTLPLAESHAPELDAKPVSYLETARAPSLVPLWFIGTVYAAALSGYFVFLKTYLEQTEIGSVGLFFTTYAWAAILLRILAGRLPERFGYKRVLFLAILAAAAGLVLVAYTSAPWQLGLAGVLCGIGHGYTFPIMSALVVSRARSNERGAAVSLFTALFDLGFLIGGPSLGAAIQLGGYPFMYIAAAVALVLALVVFRFWDDRVDQTALS